MNYLSNVDTELTCPSPTQSTSTDEPTESDPHPDQQESNIDYHTSLDPDLDHQYNYLLKPFKLTELKTTPSAPRWISEVIALADAIAKSPMKDDKLLKHKLTRTMINAIKHK